MSQYITDTAGVRIPAQLAECMARASRFVPNTWNPNRMDVFMRGKLETSIDADGFIMPLLVRPAPEGVDADWEIIDGEHRWRTGVAKGMPEIPYVNLGPVSDSQAKQITVKANALRGEFDSVKLAEMVDELAKDIGMAALEAALPYTSERLQAMVSLLNIDTNLAMGGLGSGDDEKDTGKKDDEFKTFDPDTMSLEHKCPRCGFGFNTKK